MKLKPVLISTLVVVATPTNANEVQIGHNVFAVTLKDFDAHPMTLAAAKMRYHGTLPRSPVAACE